MVKRNDSITLFNEKLINYGHNKITFVENLRFHGIDFHLVSFHRVSVCIARKGVCIRYPSRQVKTKNIHSFQIFLSEKSRKGTNDSKLV